MSQPLDFFIGIFEHFGDPKKRVFLGYLFLSILIAFIWLLVARKMSLRAAIAKVFDKKIFFSRSSRGDYTIFFINRIFTLFISPLLLTQLVVATGLFHLLHRVDWPEFPAAASLPTLLIIMAFTVTIFVLDDLTKYIVHRWMHKWPLLWALHKTHHSATNLTPLTIYRTHPLEGIVFSLRSAFTQGVALSIFFYWFDDKVDLMTVLGVNVLVFTFNVAGSNLRHSHIGIRYWRWLEYVLISPAQHQLHHSVAVQHHDKNFGATLAVWDWLFGSLHHSVETEDLTLGLGQGEPDTDHSLYAMYLRPLLEIYLYLRRRARTAALKITTLFRPTPSVEWLLHPSGNTKTKDQDEKNASL